jgi:predicted methyltransferase
MFNRLTFHQVNTVHKFFHFLRKLKVIGLIETNTENVRMTEMGKPFRYKLTLLSYDASMKNRLTPLEKLEQYFIASEELEVCIQPK